MNETKELYRLDHGALAGAYDGVAEYSNVDADLVRPIRVVLYFVDTAGLWLYVVVALLLPKKSQIYPDWRGRREIRYGGRPSGDRRASVIGTRRRY